jgi:hypothetical protein
VQAPYVLATSYLFPRTGADMRVPDDYEQSSTDISVCNKCELDAGRQWYLYRKIRPFVDASYLDDLRWQEPTCAETAYESKGAAAQRELGELKAARVRVGDSDADDDDEDTAVRVGASAVKRKASASGKFVFLLIFYFFMSMQQPTEVS